MAVSKTEERPKLKCPHCKARLPYLIVRSMFFIGRQDGQPHYQYGSDFKCPFCDYGIAYGEALAIDRLKTGRWGGFPKQVKIYHGDNSTQEFYESANSKHLLMRLHNETKWVYFRSGVVVANGIIKADDKLENVLKQIIDTYFIELIVSDEKEWKQRTTISPRYGMNMVLRKKGVSKLEQKTSP